MNQCIVLVGNQRDQKYIQECCPKTNIKSSDVDMDSIDVHQTKLVVTGGLDFLSQIAGRLAARYMSAPEYFFYIMPPTLANRLHDAEIILDNVGLHGKYQIIVPCKGYMMTLRAVIT